MTTFLQKQIYDNDYLIWLVKDDFAIANISSKVLTHSPIKDLSLNSGVSRADKCLSFDCKNLW